MKEKNRLYSNRILQSETGRIGITLYLQHLLQLLVGGGLPGDLQLTRDLPLALLTVRDLDRWIDI